LDGNSSSATATPENAPQIRAAIQTLRAQLKQARDASQPAVPGIIQLQMRLDALIEEISRMARRILDPIDRTALQELAVHAIHKLTDVSESLESAR
jgi:capsule polysaccharide export protein KpsE/RkpR